MGRDLALLGDVARGRGDYPGAIASARAAVAILRTHLLAKPEELSEALAGLGTALAYAGRATEATVVQEEAESRERAHPRSTFYAGIVGSLAFTYDMLGQGPRADSGYRRSLALFDSLPEPAPVERATTEFALANHLILRRAYVEADSAGMRALRIFTRWNGADHVWIAHVHATLAACALGQGQLPRALSEVEAALRILEGKSVSAMEKTRIQVQQANVLAAMGRQPEASRIAENVLAQRRAAIPDEPLMMGEVTYLLGSLRLHDRRLAEAEPLFLEAYASYQKAMGKTSSFAKGTAAALVFLYTAWGKPAQAAPFAALLPPAFVTTQTAAALKWARQKP